VRVSLAASLSSEGPTRSPVEDGKERVHIGRRHGLVEGDAERAVGEAAQVDAVEVTRLHHLVGAHAHGLHLERVEERFVADGVAELAQALREQSRGAVHVPGDAAQPLGAVVNGVHARHDGEQHLRGADVGGRLVAPDVLLARLQGHAERRVAVAVHGQADDAAGHLPLEAVARGEEGGVRAAVAERHAEALTVAHGHVGAPRARGLDQAEREQVARGHHVGTGGVGRLGGGPVVHHLTVGGGVLHEAAEHGLVERPRLMVTDLHLQPHRHGAGLDDGNGLGMAAARDEEAAAVRAYAREQHHRLGGGGALVEERGVGDLEARQVGDDGLVVEQCFEAALGDLGLVGCVLGVPGRILEHVALDHGGRDRVVVAHAEKAAPHLVELRQFARPLQQLCFGERGGQVERPVGANGVGDRLGHERVEAVGADGGEHLSLFVRRGAVVAALETVGVLERHRRGKSEVLVE
jgi:hypothetical protein